jgi:hypothetical protein
MGVLLMSKPLPTNVGELVLNWLIDRRDYILARNEMQAMIDEAIRRRDAADALFAAQIQALNELAEHEENSGLQHLAFPSWED